MVNNKLFCRLIFAVFLSLLFLAVCSKSSLLYPMNDWVDVNCFLTVGRAQLAGGTLYADIYDQKGPLLYFVFSLAAQISAHSYIGVYIIEVIAFSLFLFFSAECASFYVNAEWLILSVMAVLAAAVTSSKAFTHGGSAEELFFFLIPLSLYLVIRAQNRGSALNTVDSLVIGICAAAALWVKFTICGFFLGLGISVLISYVRDRRRISDFAKTIGGFFAGMAILSALILGYFLYRGALPDLFRGYFYNNLFMYGDGRAARLLGKLYYTVYGIVTVLVNAGWVIPLVIGIVWLIRTKRRERPHVLLSLGCLIVLTYIGGRHFRYYGLIFAPFAVFGLSAVAGYMESRIEKIRRQVSKKSAAGAICALTVLLLVITYAVSDNVYLMKYERDDLPQYRFAKIITETEDSTLLNYGFLDGGFYFAAGRLPICKYFCKLNIPDENFPEMMAEQNRIVRERRVDFVVTKDQRLEEISADADGYTLVDEAAFTFEGKIHTYYLYKLKDVGA